MLADAYAVVDDGEVWLRNMHIPPYPPAAQENHEPDRPRKLLLHAHEIERLVGATAQKGLTLVPIRVYFKGPRAKVEIALARGKEGRDRRREIRDREVQARGRARDAPPHAVRAYLAKAPATRLTLRPRRARNSARPV